MRAAPPLVFPSSRVLAGWWPQLAPWAPPSLAVAHLLLHHVEALVRCDGPPPLDRLTLLVLRALALTSPSRLAELEERLHLGRQVLIRVLEDLVARGLGEVAGLDQWRDTPAGTALVAAGGTPLLASQRRAFHFRDAPQPTFLPLEATLGEPVSPPAGWRFDPAVLSRCVGESDAWKRSRGFPQDVYEVLTPDWPAEPPAAWQRLIVDQAEHLVLVLAVGETQLHGFTVDPRSWQLSAVRPALTLGPSWREAFPELGQPPALETWQSAWRACCQLRGVPSAEAEACRLSLDGVLLRVAAPRELLARWGREDVWLLAGEGMMRTAARVEVSL